MANKSSNYIKLKVGESVFEVTREELVKQDDNSYFHIQLSDRWKTGDDDALTVRGRSGRLFQFVLYYLQFGDIPRKALTVEPLIDQETLNQVKEEADFFLLPKLAVLCTTEASIVAASNQEQKALDEFRKVRNKAENRLLHKLDAVAADMRETQDEPEEDILKMYLRAERATMVGDVYSFPKIGLFSNNGEREKEKALVFKLYYQIDRSSPSYANPYGKWFWDRYHCVDEQMHVDRHFRNISYYHSVTAKTALKATEKTAD